MHPVSVKHSRPGHDLPWVNPAQHRRVSIGDTSEASSSDHAHSRPLGVLTLTDLLHHEAQGGVLLTRNIFAVENVAQLAEQSLMARQTFVRLAKENANSYMIGSTMAVIRLSFKQRLLVLAKTRFWPTS
ncbi:MAG: hypothetical protein KDI27_01040 [Gammaproteobacteria bacterium]|nr:hypothetical protein [Gammaproteobacteria bacterium]